MLTYPVGTLNPKTGNAFKFSINTALGTGTTFALPLPSGQTYDFWWTPGDGSSARHVTAYNDATATYDYGTPFSGQISIEGKCGGFSFNAAGDRLKITSVDNWGDVGFDNLTNAFYGCTNLAAIPDGSITGAGNVTIFNLLFSTCTSLVAIPSGIFDLLPQANGFSNVFANCFAISSLPNNLFLNNKLVTDYGGFAIGCRNMVLPAVIWDLAVISIVTTFSFALNGASTIYSHTGTIQDIWNYNSGISTNTFKNQIALTNYAAIPNAWKGL